ncbi:2-dehydro-3-deoxygalactonokinase [Cyclobacterium lianum]|uniref:2-dehydro-3-deoxygalactonokinase n=1 Tax=Cyclobacterium lianum TaxID=388280 RepID=A0A1M7QH99_9BACT|nr:2-dehydro-3-deoxygalactonokinase [Cyclobacterium lianum]SHN30523.1 2-dehydro-3-deoxygalactonokinase [Cyclobacterium lianum]
MNTFLSCDWGTSSFRLRLVSRTGGHVLQEYTSPDGVQQIYNAYQQELQSSDRESYFFAFLNNKISAFSMQTDIDLDGLLLVCSGMASSSIGIKSLAYAGLPFSCSGRDVVFHFFKPSANFGHPLLLVSGVRAEEDVMRGEETQLIGVMAKIKDVKGNGMFIFPGTHSKHVAVQNQKISNFQTFMTGEVYSLMSRASILSKSVSSSDSQGPEMEKAFEQGVADGAEQNLLSAFFKVRAKDLFGKFNKFENSQYLSGLLIGNELGNLADESGNSVFLCSDARLSGYYSKALQILDIPSTVLSPELLRYAAVYGQIEIINQIEMHEKDIFLGCL